LRLELLGSPHVAFERLSHGFTFERHDPLIGLLPLRAVARVERDREATLPGCVHELDERRVVGNRRVVVAQFHGGAHREIGVALDDFGTGFASLAYLNDFPFSKIKIDRKFSENIDQSPRTSAIIRGIAQTTRDLRIELVAEGVETLDQLSFLADEGCDAVQGYLLGKPFPIGQYATVVGRDAKAGANVMEPARKTG